MSKENTTPTTETTVNQSPIPDLVQPPQNVYIQNSQDTPPVWVMPDVKIK